MYKNIVETAEHFRVSDSTLRKWIKSGTIPSDTYIKVGGTYRFDLARVEDALLERDVQQADQPKHPKVDMSKYNGD